MRKHTVLTIGLAAAGWSGGAWAQTDFLTAAKISCAPERMTRCKEPGVECETRDAGERDRATLLVIDFAGKKATMRRATEERPFGDVTEDKVEGEVRRVVIAPARNADNTMSIALRKDGKMEALRSKGRIKIEAACAAAS